jgi:hypothetical protein
MRPWFFYVFVVLLGLALPACSQQSQLASEIMPQSGYAPDAGVLSVHVSGFGSVISTDRQQTVFCQVTCDTFLGTGASVVLKATPQPGYHFAGWSGACSGIGNCNVNPGCGSDCVCDLCRGGGPGLKPPFCASHAMPHCRHTKSSRAIWRAIPERANRPGIHYSEQRLQHTRHGPGLFTERNGGSSHSAGFPYDLPLWAGATAGIHA